MSDAPSLITSGIATLGTIAVAVIQRGSSAISKELRSYVDDKVVPRIADLEKKVGEYDGRIRTIADSVAVAAREASETKRGLTTLREYVQHQLAEAKREWDRFRRASSSDLASALGPEDIGGLLRDISDVRARLEPLHDLPRRVEDIEEELAENRRA